MKRLPAILALSLTLSTTLSAAELLLNGSFEGPVGAANGNNLGTVPTNWIVGSTATATSTTNTNLANLVVGTATGTQPAGAANTVTLPPYDGNQSLDGNGATIYAIQTFTLPATSALRVQAVFGGRDYTTASSTSNWTITTAAAPGTVLYQGTPTAPAFGQWVADIGTTGVLPAGDYRINVTLANPHQVDLVSVTNVPEPSVLTAIAAGALLVGAGVRRSRQS